MKAFTSAYIELKFAVTKKLYFMNRYNIFYQVHKGLRAMLYETALCLQQTDFNTPEETEKSLAQLETVIALFEKHAHTEDTIVFAAIHAQEPALVSTFEQEHEEDNALAIRINGLLTAFKYAVSSEDKASIGAGITQAFIDFMVFNLKHMAKEEDIINKALWRHYSDMELHALTQQILRALPSLTLDQYSKWMMRGLSNNEIIAWLRQVKNTAPDFVFQALMKTMEDELCVPRRQWVQEGLTEGALVA